MPERDAQLPEKDLGAQLADQLAIRGMMRGFQKRWARGETPQESLEKIDQIFPPMEGISADETNQARDLARRAITLASQKNS